MNAINLSPPVAKITQKRGTEITERAQASFKKVINTKIPKSAEQRYAVTESRGACRFFTGGNGGNGDQIVRTAKAQRHKGVFLPRLR